MNEEEIVKRYEALNSERKGTVESIWELIERFVMPFRGDFYQELNQEAEVDWHRREIYDATAVFAAQSLAASLHGNLTSAGQRWMGLKFRDDDINKDDTAREWLDDCTQILYDALNDSAFDVEIAEAYMDLVGFGTTCLTEEIDKDNKLVFSAIPVREIYFEEDHNKQVYRLFRRLQWTPVQIVSKFGEENVPRQIREKVDNPESSTQRLDVIFCVYERPDKKNADTSKPLVPKQRPYGFKYVLKDGQELLGEEGGYFEMPSFVARWRKTTGSRWGHSPATVCMADILTLNQVKEATLEAAAKAIDPANLALDSALVGDLDLDRGGLTVVTDIDGLRPYESGSKFDVSNMEIEMLTQTIRQAFYQDQLELKESPAMTATEVNVRYELMQRLLGPTFGRLKTDLLDPLVKRTFQLLYRAGQMPELPEDLQGQEMDIEYLGPLPRSQAADTALSIQNFIGNVAGMAEIFPEALDIIDVDAAVRELAQLQGVPAAALRSETDIQDTRKARSQQQAQVQGLAAAQGAGEAMQAIGEGAQAIEGFEQGGNVQPIASGQQ